MLESFGIMDYSLLLGVHNIDHAQQEMAEVGRRKLGRGGGGRSELEGRGGGNMTSTLLVISLIEKKKAYLGPGNKGGESEGNIVSSLADSL